FAPLMSSNNQLENQVHSSLVPPPPSSLLSLAHTILLSEKPAFSASVACNTHHLQAQRLAVICQPCNPLLRPLIAATGRDKCHFGMGLLGQSFRQRPWQRIRVMRRNIKLVQRQESFF